MNTEQALHILGVSPDADQTEIKKTYRKLMHRLYLCTRSGKQAGYLSFRDDRMYYIVIPLLEQKRAQIKVEVSEKQETIQQRKGRKYKNIDFWLRIPGKYCGTCLENSNLRIKSLLEQYADDK